MYCYSSLNFVCVVEFADYESILGPKQAFFFFKVRIVTWLLNLLMLPKLQLYLGKLIALVVAVPSVLSGNMLNMVLK